MLNVVQYEKEATMFSGFSNTRHTPSLFTFRLTELQTRLNNNQQGVSEDALPRYVIFGNNMPKEIRDIILKCLFYGRRKPKVLRADAPLNLEYLTKSSGRGFSLDAKCSSCGAYLLNESRFVVKFRPETIVDSICWHDNANEIVAVYRYYADDSATLKSLMLV